MKKRFKVDVGKGVRKWKVKKGEKIEIDFPVPFSKQDSILPFASVRFTVIEEGKA
jgi:hypothetical protein